MPALAEGEAPLGPVVGWTLTGLAIVAVVLSARRAVEMARAGARRSAGNVVVRPRTLRDAEPQLHDADARETRRLG